MAARNLNNSHKQIHSRVYKQALEAYSEALEIYQGEQNHDSTAKSSYVGEAIALNRIASVYRRQSEDVMKPGHDVGNPDNPIPPSSFALAKPAGHDVGPPPDPSRVALIKALQKYQEQLNHSIEADSQDNNRFLKADKLLELGDTYLMMARIDPKEIHNE